MDKLNEPGKLDYGEKLKPVNDEAKAWKTVWSAGQGVSQISDVVSVSDLVQRITSEYEEARSRICG
jgi:nitronate monooxygenase